MSFLAIKINAVDMGVTKTIQVLILINVSLIMTIH